MNVRGLGRLLAVVMPLVLLVLSESPAMAQSVASTSSPEAAAGESNSEEGPWVIDASLTLASDYHYRGVSLSDGKPVLQGELSIEHESGLFASAWASTLPADGGGPIEIDLSAGYAFEIGRVSPSIGATVYLYPGAKNFDYVEGFAALDIPVGAATVSLGAAYAPEQANLDEDNLYLSVAAEVPVKNTGLTIDAALGHEDGAFADKKINWQLGIRYAVNEHVEIGAAYVDSHRAFASHAGPKAVFTLTVAI